MKILQCSNGDLISCSIHGPINIWNKNNNEYKIFKN